MASNGRADNRMKGAMGGGPAPGRSMKDALGGGPGWERQIKPMGPTAPKPMAPRPAAPKSAGDLALKLLGGKGPRRI